MENPKIFWNLTPFTYCPRDFFESRPPKYTNIDTNRTISARYVMLVLIFNALREEDIYDLESCIRFTLNFFNFS